MEEKLTSSDLKKALASHMFWRLHYSVVVDEYSFMDILGVRRNGYAVEFEVKVSRSDFMREINIIHGEQPKTKWGKDWAKWEKHANYLKRTISKVPSVWDSIPGYEEKAPKYFTPNEFNFYVPDYLTEFALSKLANLPYGLVQYGKTSHNGGISYFFSRYEVIKKPQKLHSDKRCSEIMEKLAHALTIRSRLLT
jgi:hypothetical protein